jgi:hypothetical protein
MKAIGLGHPIRVRDGWALITMENSILRVTGKGSAAGLNTITAGTGTAIGTATDTEKGTGTEIGAETIGAENAGIGVPLSAGRAYGQRWRERVVRLE